MNEIVTVIGAIAGTWLGYLIVLRWLQLGELSHIPTIGSSGYFTSIKTAVEYIFDSLGVLQQGYDKYPGGAFKIWTFSGWIVIVSGREMVEDIRKAKDEVLSFEKVAMEQLQAKYTLGPEVIANPFHIEVIRTTLTRHIVGRFDQVYDEIQQAYSDLVPMKEDGEWVSVTTLDFALNIVSRVGNRFMVGLPVCRNPEYIKLNIDFTIQLFTSAIIINFFPEFMKPLVGTLISVVPRSVRKGKRILGPMLQHRLEQHEKYGRDWPNNDRPNDLISWLLDSNGIGPRQRTVNALTEIVLTVNTAAEHTSSMSFTHALYDLTTNPQYIEPLREEIDQVVAQYGWTKKALGYMYKVDSFLKESQRIYGLASLALNRKVMQPFTFSNGLTLPAGSYLAVPSSAIHLDDKNYPDAQEFKPFRFSDVRQSTSEFVNEHMVTPKPEYLAFGAGKHACPGRFLAATEIKALLAHALYHYDVKMEGELVRPKNIWMAHNMTPSPHAKIMFRKRQSCAD